MKRVWRREIDGIDRTLGQQHKDTKWGNIFRRAMSLPSSRDQTCRMNDKALWSCSGVRWCPTTWGCYTCCFITHGSSVLGSLTKTCTPTLRHIKFLYLQYRRECLFLTNVRQSCHKYHFCKSVVRRHIAAQLWGFTYPISCWFIPVNMVILLCKWKCMKLWWVIFRLEVYWSSRVSLASRVTRGPSERDSQSRDRRVRLMHSRLTVPVWDMCLLIVEGIEKLLCCQSSSS